MQINFFKLESKHLSPVLDYKITFVNTRTQFKRLFCTQNLGLLFILEVSVIQNKSNSDLVCQIQLINSLQKQNKCLIIINCIQQTKVKNILKLDLKQNIFSGVPTQQKVPKMLCFS